MSWAKLTDDFYDHPKIVAVGNEAVGLWVRCLTYSSRYLLDGFIPTAVVDRMNEGGQDLLERLEQHRLMTRSTGGFLIPDFLDFNPSSAEVNAKREKQRAGGKAGARKRWSGSGGVEIDRTPGPVESPEQAEARAAIAEALE